MFENILQMQTKLHQEGHISAILVAATCARLGDQAAALRYLQTSYDEHDPTFLEIREDEAFAAMHEDPKFQKLVIEAGLPPL